MRIISKKSGLRLAKLLTTVWFLPYNKFSKMKSKKRGWTDMLCEKKNMRRSVESNRKTMKTKDLLPVKMAVGPIFLGRKLI